MKNRFRWSQYIPLFAWTPLIGNFFLLILGLITWLTPYSLRGPRWILAAMIVVVVLYTVGLRIACKQKIVRRFLSANILASLLLFSFPIEYLSSGRFQPGLMGILIGGLGSDRSQEYESPKGDKFTLSYVEGIWDSPGGYIVYVNRFSIFQKQLFQFTTRLSAYEIASKFSWSEDGRKVTWNSPELDPSLGNFNID